MLRRRPLPCLRAEPAGVGPSGVGIPVGGGVQVDDPHQAAVGDHRVGIGIGVQEGRGLLDVVPERMAVLRATPACR
jgi:hypothetical protein